MLKDPPCEDPVWSPETDEGVLRRTVEVMERHLAALRRAYGDPMGVRVARKHINWYLDGRPEARETRCRLMRTEQADEQLRLLRAYFRWQATADQGPGKRGQLAA